jgi:sec-independent protein translocase protein TatB
MFDIGWSEMAVIALLTLIVIGPRELPRVLRTVGQWVRKAQSLAREFQRGLDDMAREADLEDAKKLVDAGRSIANPKKMVMDTLDPTGSLGDEAKDLQTAMTAEPKDDVTTGKSGESVKAAIVKQPVNIAPPQSIAPPPDAKAGTKSKPKAKPKAKSAPKAKAKSAPKAKAKSAPASSHGSQKTA